MNDFRIYILPGCKHCNSLTNILDDNHVSYETVSIADDPIILSGLQQFAGEIKVPITVHFSSQQVFVGVNPELLKLLGITHAIIASDRGIGDTIKRILARLGFKSCAACEIRAAKLNRWFPYRSEKNV